MTVHPILARGRLRLYLAAWVPVGGLLTALAMLAGERSVIEALALTLPLALLYAFVCLGSWSLCRALPLGPTSIQSLTTAHAAAAAVSSALWLVFGLGWAEVVARILADPGVTLRYRADLPLLFAVGVLLFVLAAAVHYLLIAFEASRTAERRAMSLQVLARDAQLKALRAQIDPHFLFNSLNSISALAGFDAAAARRMCLLLAEFLRKSLSLGAKDEIRFAEEMALVDSFLAVEQVRLGPRLAIDRRIEAAAEACLVPPLMLQPLVENAVNHGIAGRIEGGTLRIEARIAAGRLEIVVANPFEADRPASRGQGLGLANVRERLAALHGAGARLEVRSEGETFRVALSLPAVTARDSSQEPGTPHTRGAEPEAASPAVAVLGATRPAASTEPGTAAPASTGPGTASPAPEEPGKARAAAAGPADRPIEEGQAAGTTENHGR